jgi:hypothetical protein
MNTYVEGFQVLSIDNEDYSLMGYSTSETLMYFNMNTWRYTPKGCNLHLCGATKKKSVALQHM